MLDIIDILETVGRNASLLHASEEHEPGVDASLRDDE
jgi:hypothetical protein